jgi:general secretion pathway protein D
VIDRRSADTVVVTPSDRTIVIGGLISSQKNDTDTKVPILGDIPILGYAFKRKKKEDTKTELLIFLTPHVVATPEDLASVTENERSKLNMAPTVFDKAELNKFIPPSKN